MVSAPERIADGIGLPEGPVWCDDGTLVVTAVAEGALYRIWPGEGRKAKIADTAGGPNAAAPADDGGFVVTQNGGIDFGQVPLPPEEIRFPPPERPSGFVPGGLQRVAADGTVTRLLSDMQASNDLVVGPDGTIYFTDPPRFPVPPGARLARVMARAPDGNVRLIADDLVYVNGIVREPDGNLVVTEGDGLMRIGLDGCREWICEDASGSDHTDGMALDRDGRIYMAGVLGHGVRVMEDGGQVDFLPLPGKGVSTNCCFGGPDDRWLFVTEGWPGTVWVWHDLPTPGLPLFKWPAPRE
ncbi:SMP-30/gluconolactonase/LRE family protein [uncultured Sphingomonas sp.]|uniref:SMP-30/gluconolactonase/LRE family protein n=1 Tax=uncultured Sphingomonas sp. TaxID=158754 RepID=UPI0035CBE1E2